MSLYEALEKGIVLITFDSLTSNNTYSREYTLKDEYLPTKFDSQSGDKLIVFNVDFQKWEDIEVSTIKKWKRVE